MPSLETSLDFKHSNILLQLSWLTPFQVSEQRIIQDFEKQVRSNKQKVRLSKG